MADDPMTTDYMLTTVDNPFSPFDEFTEWLAYDTQKGYNTSGMLARICNSSHDLSEASQQYALQAAIIEICEFNVKGIWRKVTRDFYKDRIDLK